MYQVKEIFYSLQGEGTHAGRPAVFCRFSGCNLWNGRDSSRRSAICSFCDTDFVGTDGVGGGQFKTADELSCAIDETWTGESHARAKRFVVFTGGEPTLQIDSALVDRLHHIGFEVAIETNGTRMPPSGLDWVCVSPKAGSELVVTSGDELKLVFPQHGAEPELFENLPFSHLLLQPMDGPELRTNTDLAVEYCLRNPQWHLSIQSHKVVGIR